MESDGWLDSAHAWVECVDQGDPNRNGLLDPILLAHCGDVRGQRCLDIGCGEGRFSRFLQERGAIAVGFDPIAPLAQYAVLRNSGHIACADAEKIPFRAGVFDLVISYLVWLDVPDYREGIREAARVLKPGGKLIAANLNSFVTTTVGWYRDENGERLHYPVDHYNQERYNWVGWKGIMVKNWHRPLANYMNAYLGAGLVLRAYEEPVPPAEQIREWPSLRDYLRVPMMNVMVWEKPK
ncbi:MAG: class I SAM-dependent methyltransferase [Armatimonadetes bacterium]|nr:class I SAM-dependent methyltransferase [Armatimonadota bacterium]